MLPINENKLVLQRFLVTIVVDEFNPKFPTTDELLNRIADGPQWLDGVHKVDIEYKGRVEPDAKT